MLTWSAATFIEKLQLISVEGLKSPALGALHNLGLCTPTVVLKTTSRTLVCAEPER